MADRRPPTDDPVRAPWQYALSAVFALGALSDLLQIGEWLLGNGHAPAPLMAWHGVTAATALACLVAVWQRRGWATRAVAAWGVANTTLLVSLPLLVAMPDEARPGVWVGAGAVAVLTIVCMVVVDRNMKRQ